MPKKLHILAVCGSGTVSSTMVAEKASDYLESLGYSVDAEESNPAQATEKIPSGNYDLVVYTSPIPGKYTIPIVNGVGLLTGIGEEEVYEKLKEALKDIEK
ncbi:Phosphotransferase system, galactitol-specific IIB component [Lacticaseibacillus paracasei]|uniref:PTS sugar transporter subunit IIB n=1 Tax=Lacticaseibacillus paracasei TaxID=1597 RepID=UPI000F0B6548|nr:PTS sugar transporter subunit IIB [Lacticaseibacillus paracasei]RND87021.1 Phosphotransferase system, galactitol-specific IIB component [Lacticaseibacillus paracasei]